MVNEMIPYIQKSEFGFSSEDKTKGYSYLFGDMINEENPKDDKVFTEALNEFLNQLRKMKISYLEIQAKEKTIKSNWEKYLKFFLDEQKQ